MYAVAHAVSVNDRSAAEAGLEQVVPHVSGLPGFVAGYWTEHSDNQGLALIVFDSREAAQGFADFLKAAPDAPGVTPNRESIGVCEVLAHA
jgi:hypothetical protein